MMPSKCSKAASAASAAVSPCRETGHVCSGGGRRCLPQGQSGAEREGIARIKLPAGWRASPLEAGPLERPGTCMVWRMFRAALPYFTLLQEALYLRPCRRCRPYGGSTAGCQRRRPALRLPSRRVSRTPAHIPAAARIFTRRYEGRSKRANEQRAEGFGDAFSG